MIDKLQLNVPHGSFKAMKEPIDGARWQIMPHQKVIGSPLPVYGKSFIKRDTLLSPLGEPCQKFFYNAEKYSVSVNAYGASIVFNPAVVIFGDNKYRIESDAQIKNSCDKIFQDMALSDLMTFDKNKTTISRLDTCIDATLDHNFRLYENVFSLFHLSRTHAVNFGDTYRLSNKSFEFQIYDKIAQRLFEGREVTNEERRSTVGRNEIKSKKKKNVLSVYGISKLNDLYNDGILGELKIRHKNIVKQCFDKCVLNEDVQTNFFADMQDTIHEIVRTSKARTLSKNLWQMFAVRGHAMVAYKPDTLRDMLKKEGLNKMAISRFIKDVVDATRKYSTVDRMKLTSLFQELKEKFLLVA